MKVIMIIIGTATPTYGRGVMVIMVMMVVLLIRIVLTNHIRIAFIWVVNHDSR